MIGQSSSFTIAPTEFTPSYLYHAEFALATPSGTKINTLDKTATAISTNVYINFSISFFIRSLSIYYEG